MLQHAYFLAKIGVDTAGKEPLEVPDSRTTCKRIHMRGMLEKRIYVLSAEEVSDVKVCDPCVKCTAGWPTRKMCEVSNQYAQNSSNLNNIQSDSVIIQLQMSNAKINSRNRRALMTFGQNLGLSQPHIFACASASSFAGAAAFGGFSASVEHYQHRNTREET